MVMLSKTLEDRAGLPHELESNIAERGTWPTDTRVEGENRAHIARGRDLAHDVSAKTGSVHPMTHAGLIGKGRW